MHIPLEQKFSKITMYWHPYIVGELNENYVKIAKLRGEFVWHHHEQEDELFMVVSGTLKIDFRDKTVAVGPGEMYVVPKGVEHRPRTDGEEVQVVLIEPKCTRHTGQVQVDQTVTQLTWL